jgi:hypothetical protein
MRRFEALTGGEDGGARCFGVSKAFALGIGTLPLGIFGVCTDDCWDILDCGAGVWTTPDCALALRSFGGVLGSVTSDKYAE